MNCKQGTDIIIQQMIELLDKLDDQAYSQPLALFNGSSIGQHFRHIVDFYGCILAGTPEGRIDYAQRERDARVETETAYAAAVLRQFTTRLNYLTEEESIEIIADFSAELNESRPVIHTTIARELMYAYDHAVHHLAMIKMGLKVAQPAVDVDSSLGVAPSTLKHWKSKPGSARKAE
jgi:uncharacterized damage-inducible protein DinB